MHTPADAIPLLRTTLDPRVRSFVWLLAAAGVSGALVGAFGHLQAFALLLAPPYVMWIRADLRTRGVRGGLRVGQLVLALVPGWGLLGYLLWTRRLVGVLQWTAFAAALYIVAALTGCLGHGIAQLVRGERW